MFVRFMRGCGVAVGVLFVVSLVAISTAQAGETHLAGLERYLSGGLVVASAPLNESEKLVLIGVRSNDDRYPTAETLRGWGFEGASLPQSPNTVDPSFVIRVEGQKLREVYSFELGRFPHMTYAQFGKNEAFAKRVLDQANHPEKYPGLPPKILNVPNARRNLAARGAFKLLLTAAEFAPFQPLGAAAALIQMASRQQDRLRDKQAAYLAQAIRLNLERNLCPELADAFTHDQLVNLGSALLIRYNAENPWKGLFVSKSERSKYYQETLTKREARDVEHQKVVEAYAKQKGLTVTPLGPGFLLLSISRSDLSDEKIARLEPKLRERLMRYKNAPASEGDLIPYRIYALDEKMPKFDTVDFQSPLKDATLQRITDLTETGVEVGFIFLDLWSGIGAGVAWATTEKAAEWLGYTIFQYRLAAYGRLQANLKTGAVNLDEARLNRRGVLIDALLDHARAMGVPEAEVKKLDTELKNCSDAELGQKLAFMLSELVELESRYAGGLESRDLEVIRRVKRIHFARLKNWIDLERQLTLRPAG